jgi:hypothetical protein
MADSHFENVVGQADAFGTQIDTFSTETLFLRHPVAAGKLAYGKRFQVRITGKYSTTSTPTLGFAIRVVDRAGGSTTGVVVAKTPLVTCPSGVTDAPFEIDVEISTRTNGASGVLFGQGHAIYHSGSASPAVGTLAGSSQVVPMTSAGATVPATVTRDLTVDMDIIATAIYSASSASNKVQYTDYAIAERN